MAQNTFAINRPRLMLVAAVAALALAALALAGPGAPAAHARSCPQVDLPGNGYITSLRVTNVSCRRGKEVAVAYARCRLRKGRTGRCTSRVLRYSCKETKRRRIATEINALVTCTRGSRKVVHTYQQNL